jgi:hypothetical protein
MRSETFNPGEEINDLGKHYGGRVTATELLTELSAIQAAFKWHVTKQGRIRAWLKNDSAKQVFDPITAVAYFRTGRFYPEGHWTNAANAIGLVASDCAELVAAGNYEWDPSCRQGVLRERLLNTIVSETASPARHALTDVFLRFRKRSATPTTH